jgi:hypothetical protein
MSKAEQAAEQLQEILDAFHLAGSQNSRMRSEVATLRGKVRTLEMLLNQKEKRLILLTELLSRRREQPGLPEPEVEVLEAEIVT